MTSEDLIFNNPENKCPLLESFLEQDEPEEEETIWHPV